MDVFRNARGARSTVVVYGCNLDRSTRSKMLDGEILHSMRVMGLRHGHAEPEFTERDLRKAYLRSCKKLSPDKGGDAERFVALRNAYEHLKPYARRRADTAPTESGPPVYRGHVPQVSQNSTGPRHKNVEAAYAAMYGDRGPEARFAGRGDWLKQDVPTSERAPENVGMSRLHETFERVTQRGPTTVSTYVVEPSVAHTTVGHDIHDEGTDDFSIGTLADLQYAYRGALR